MCITCTFKYSNIGILKRALFIYREDGSEWIWVYRIPNRRAAGDQNGSRQERQELSTLSDNSDDGDEMDLESLMEAWQDLLSSGRPIDKETIFELARKFHVTSGKWMIFVDIGMKGDLIWSAVAKGVLTGKTLSNIAKISTIDPNKTKTNRHVVCIYNENFLNMDEVTESERTIRSLGIKCKLCYKPDVFTYLEVYAGNKWRLNPVIYESHYDIIQQKSIINETVRF